MGRKVCHSYSRGENLFMKFFETELKGLYVIELERPEMDERGFFTRIWDKKIFPLVHLTSFTSEKGFF